MTQHLAILLILAAAGLAGSGWLRRTMGVATEPWAKWWAGTAGAALVVVATLAGRAPGGALHAAALVVAVWLAPSPHTFWSGISSRDMWAGLNDRLLPKESWFGIVDVPSRFADTPPTHNDLTTGALPNAAPSRP